MCLEPQSFRFGICAIMRSLGSLVSCWNLAPFWELVLSHSLLLDLTILEWDKSLSIFISIYFCSFGLSLVHLLNLWSFMCWIGFFLYNLDTACLVTLLCVPSRFTWCFCSNCISFLVLESFMHAYLLYDYIMACLLSLIQYIRETPPIPNG
jgi:hypothetical protein